ncbi:MAG: gluconate 2-dehydrogenase subunit 3 family protein [Haloarculaceae archaeon]
MELTRRDALAALASAGVVGGGGAAVFARERREGTDGESSERGTADPRVPDALVATAEVVYPDEVSGVREFVETYSLGRLEGRADYRTGVREAVAELDDHARAWYGEGYTSLDPDTRDDLLRSMGVDAAEEDPEGTAAEQVRFYAVNELLFALYSSPAGGRLVGIENPQGHPGGIESYRRGPR